MYYKRSLQKNESTFIVHRDTEGTAARCIHFGRWALLFSLITIQIIAHNIKILMFAKIAQFFLDR